MDRDEFPLAGRTKPLMGTARDIGLATVEPPGEAGARLVTSDHRSMTRSVVLADAGYTIS
ncbi:MAG: hypothetical protein DI629_01300 [Mesorhizobium amorphae]|nr:MAG: hypothetical protein DI629_01300 [Mesorhizobium amorphae]